jgi:hypothetical protein
VNLSQVQKLRRNNALAHREIDERYRSRGTLRGFTVDKLRRDSTFVCRDSARSAEVEKPFKVSEKESSGGRVPLRTEQQLQGVQEVGETFQGFTSPENLRRDNVFKNADGSQRYRFRRGNKGQDLWNLENLPRKMKKA